MKLRKEAFFIENLRGQRSAIFNRYREAQNSGGSLDLGGFLRGFEASKERMRLDPRGEESLDKLADFVQLLFQEEEIPAGVVDFFADLAGLVVRAENALKELDLLVLFACSPAARFGPRALGVKVEVAFILLYRLLSEQRVNSKRNEVDQLLHFAVGQAQKTGSAPSGLPIAFFVRGTARQVPSEIALNNLCLLARLFDLASGHSPEDLREFLDAFFGLCESRPEFFADFLADLPDLSDRLVFGPLLEHPGLRRLVERIANDQDPLRLAELFSFFASLPAPTAARVAESTDAHFFALVMLEEEPDPAATEQILAFLRSVESAFSFSGRSIKELDTTDVLVELGFWDYF